MYKMNGLWTWNSWKKTFFLEQSYLRVTSSKTRLINLKDRSNVRMISATGTPIRANGPMNHCKADASCSGVVVAKQRLALCKIFMQNRRNIIKLQMFEGRENSQEYSINYKEYYEVDYSEG